MDWTGIEPGPLWWESIDCQRHDTAKLWSSGLFNQGLTVRVNTETFAVLCGNAQSVSEDCVCGNLAAEEMKANDGRVYGHVVWQYQQQGRTAENYIMRSILIYTSQPTWFTWSSHRAEMGRTCCMYWEKRNAHMALTWRKEITWEI
jgi:hypothetical protein